MTRLTGWVLASPRRALRVWGVSVLVLAALGLTVNDHLTPTEITAPGTESARAAQLTESTFGMRTTTGILLQGPDAEARRQAQELIGQLRDKRVRAVTSLDPGPLRGKIDKPGQVFVIADAPRAPGQTLNDSGEPVQAALDDTIERPVRASVTGAPLVSQALVDASVEATRNAEIIAIPVLVLVLLLVFRSPVAAAIPGVMGATTVLAGFGVIRLITEVVEFDAAAMSLLSMMGLALGVDYSLLMVSRFRQSVAEGKSPEAATAAAVAAATAGRTVVVAGVVLIAAMVITLLLSPASVLLSTALGVVIVAVISVASALVAVTAVLARYGHLLDRWRLGGERPPRLLPAIVDRVMRRPVLVTALALIPLVALTLPTAGLTTRTSSTDLLPTDHPRYQDLRRIIDTVGTGWTNSYEVVVTREDKPLTDRRTLEALARYEQTVSADRRVNAAAGPGPVAERLRPLERLPAQLRRAQRLARDAPRQVAGFGRQIGAAEEGTRQLLGGLAQAVDASDRLADGAGAAGTGSRRLAREQRRARDASRALAEGLDTAARGLERLQRAIGRAAAGSRRLERGSRELRTAVGQAETGVQQLRAGLRERLLPGANALTSGLVEGAGALRELTEPAQATEDSAREAFDALQAMSIGRTDPQYERAVRAAGTAVGSASGRHPLTGERLREGYDGLAPSLRQAAEQTSRAAGASREIAGGVEQLAAGTDRLLAGSRRLADGARRLATGAGELSRGLARLDRAGRSGARGFGALTSGSDQLTTGLDQLSRGARRLEEGLGALRRGGERLSTGLDSGGDRTSELLTGFERGRRQLRGLRGRLDGLPSGRQLAGASALFASPYTSLAALDTAPRRDRERLAGALALENGAHGARWLVVPNVPFNTDASIGLRDALSDHTARLADDIGGEGAVGGLAADLVEYNDAVASRLPLMIAAIALVCWLALLIVLRGVLVSLIGVLLNLAAVGVAFGAIALAFQGDDPIMGGPGHLDVLAVSGIFAVVFGLSIDYQVFLLTRIQERVQATGDARRAVSEALRDTAGVVTGAALIMVAVFSAFATADMVTIRQFGFGLAVAVIFDATVIRLVLLPALLAIAGDRAWWSPRWLRRLLPEVDLEGTGRAAAPGAPR